MVFRIKHKHLYFILTALITACIFCIPYFVKDLLPVEHDTFFHLSRIEGLAKAIQHGDYLPAVYPEKNGMFGYTSPLFYCDIFLYPPALLYIAHVPLSICYKILIFTETFLAAYTIQCLVYRISVSFTAGTLACFAYTFANYHITDVYVRGALGEVQAMVFLPVLLEGLYILFYEEDTRHYGLIIAGLSCLVLTHNLTFLLAVVLCIVFFLCNLQKKEACISFLKASFLAFLFTAFFSIPMLEQLHEETYYLNYYASSSDLAKGALPLWKYFANTTIFGYSDNTLEHEKQMIVNIGYYLTFTPMLYCFTKKKKNRFVIASWILGYVCMVLPCTLIPWQSLSCFRILQFPWRLLQISMVLLCIPSCIAVSELSSKRYIPVILSIVLLSEGLCHVLPVTQRTFGLTASMDWSDVLEGKLCDPYYSATYKRVELAGGDYLPLPSADYRTITNTVMDENYQTVAYPVYDYNRFYFTLSDTQTVLLPKTYYKGYHVYKDGKEIPVTKSKEGLVQIQATAGTYTCTFTSTPVRKICIGISVLSIIVFCIKKWLMR